MPTSYLSDIGFLAGDAMPIEQLDGVSPELAAQLCADGLRTGRVFREAPWRMAADCVRGTLAATEVELDKVVYASEGWNDRPQDLAQDTARFLTAAGLAELTVVGAGLNRCANLGTLLTTADALIASGRSQGCLLVTVDCVGVPEERVVSGEIGVFSDSAASAVLSPGPVALRGFEVLGIESATSADLALVALSKRDWQPATPAFMVRVDDAMLRLVDRTGIKPHEFKHVLSNNYATSAIGAVHAMVDVPVSVAYRGTARDYAHCFAADGLLNLDSMLRAGALTDGDRILVLSTSANTWFLIALRYYTR